MPGFVFSSISRLASKRSHEIRRILTRLLIALIAVPVLLCSLSPLAVAADAQLVVYLTNGYSEFYPLSEVVDVSFGIDELYVTTTSGTDTYALAEVDRIDFIWDTVTGIRDHSGAPVSIDPSHLFQNYPNPFNPQTRIAFDLPSAGRAEVRIYDVRGKLIRTLVDEKLPAGLHRVRWDGRDDAGRVASSGVYFYKLTAPGVDASRKMILLK